MCWHLPWWEALLPAVSHLLQWAVSHFTIGGLPDVTVWILCIIFTLVWARIAAVFANKAKPETLNRATGIVLVVLGIVIMGFKLI